MTAMNVKLDIAGLQFCIAERENMPLRYAGLLALQAAHEFDARLFPAVQAWMEGALTADFNVEGCSLQDIMDDTEASLLEALYLLNLQIKHPKQIEECEWVLRGDDCNGIIHV